MLSDTVFLVPLGPFANGHLEQAPHATQLRIVTARALNEHTNVPACTLQDFHLAKHQERPIDQPFLMLNSIACIRLRIKFALLVSGS